jgi:Transposase
VGKREKKYSLEFQQAAVERMKTCSNVSALARELHVRRKWLYAWRTKLDPEWADRGLELAEPATPELIEERRRTEELRERIRQLERLAGQQALDLNFFKAALRAIEQQRRSRKKPGAAPSTPPSAV